MATRSARFRWSAKLMNKKKKKPKARVKMKVKMPPVRHRYLP